MLIILMVYWQHDRSAGRFLDTVQEYGLYSGLLLNTTKTEGRWLENTNITDLNH